MLRKKIQGGGLWRTIAMLLFMAVILAIAAVGISRGAKNADEESRRVLEENLRRAAVQCYALEGFYPADETYLEAEYGVNINRNKFAVHYEGFASNLMPEITVVPK